MAGEHRQSRRGREGVRALTPVRPEHAWPHRNYPPTTDGARRSKLLGKGTLMSATTTLDTKETASLIGSDKVEGTAVYGVDQKKIGKLERAMIDKVSGKVAYAVLSFGGFLGMGEEYYPVPWATLKHDTSLGGYRVNLTREQLDNAPKYSSGTDWNWSRENDRRVYDYYKAQPYWTV